MTRRLLSMFAALLLGSAAGVVFLHSSATAASGACAKGTGVTVVVGSSVSCDTNGGGDAASNFTSVGHSLTYVQRSPGFVCQIDGAPASAGCVNTPPADAYWGLFWSNGTSGTWKYSSLGAGALKVPKGGWVAFVFQTSDTKKYPAVTPSVAAAAEPTTAPSKPKSTTSPKASTKPKPTKGAATSTAPTSAPAPSVSASASTPTPTPTTTSTNTSKPTATPPTTVATTDAPPAAAQEAELTPTSSSKANDSSNGLGWVAGGIGVLLLAGMGVTVWRRRAAGGPS